MAVTPRDRTAIDRLLPRYRYGVILPGTGGVQRGVDYQFYRLAPLDVMQIGVGLGIRDYSDVTPDSAREAFWRCVETLQAEAADCIVLSGVPVSAGMGRARVREMLDDVSRGTGLRAYATLESIIAALEFLGVSRIAMASRFPPETNASIAAYLAEAGVQVLATTARDLSLSQARQLSMLDGMQLALEIGREAAERAPTAEAILLPGGATLSLHAIPALEAELGKPVLINLSAEVWHVLVAPGVIPPVTDWGCLLANRGEVQPHGS